MAGLIFYENKLGGCLADDMGLGKTVQTIALVRRIYRKSKKPTLIVMELPENWEQFLTLLETEKSALSPENKFKIFTLADRPDLQRHFMQDSYLRKLSLRVEGHRVAIEQKNVPLVRAYLRNLGYLVQS